jgi:hypothetical protein
MPGFFDLFFRSEPEPEPKAPKPKKVKKAKKAKKAKKVERSEEPSRYEDKELATQRLGDDE